MAANEIPIASYQCKLLNRVEVAEGTMAFYFEKPSRFDFKPGRHYSILQKLTLRETRAHFRLPVLHLKTS